METQVRAGIFFYDGAMRYAEIEDSGEVCTLLRLGSCDFDFNALESVLSGEGADDLETISEAISDVFAGSKADEICIALHPRACYSFFTTVPADASEEALKNQVLKETALVADNETTLYVASEEVLTEQAPDGTSSTWIHVLALPEDVRKRLEGLLVAFEDTYTRYVPAVQGAAAVIERLELKNGLPDIHRPYSLGVGMYPTHTEFAVCREASWYHNHFVLASSPTDRAYFAAALLNRLGIQIGEVGRVYVYGEDIGSHDTEVFESVFGHAPVKLNPLAVVTVEGKGKAGFEAGSYVPCIGVTV